MTIDKTANDLIASALSRQYVSMYYVDIETGNFKQLVPSRVIGVKDMPKEGDNFFDIARENAPEFVDSKDLDELMLVYDKKSIIRKIDNKKPFIVDCRFVYNGEVVHVRHITMLCDDNRHMLCCLENIDKEYYEKEEQKRNLESAEELARQDKLTGVKNRNAFLELSEKMNREIREGKSEKPFGILVCDVNNLKHMNDTRGHSFGDEAIKKASRMICETFKHSPVFRTGGDEFVAILTGSDYEHRNELLVMFRDESMANRRTSSGPEVASGMTDYRPGKDKDFNAVFERADAEMYENKKYMKANKILETYSHAEEHGTPITEDRKRLLDSRFGALYTVSGGGYVYLNDLRYDYSRWAHELVADFGLKSEYMYHADKTWRDFIHPDDIESYEDAIKNVLNGDMVKPLIYRARRADGTYAILSTRGFILNDIDGNPEYFGGIIIPH